MKLHDSGDKRGLVGGSISRLAEECSGFRGWARGVSTCARAAAGSILAYVGACTPNGQGIYLFTSISPREFLPNSKSRRQFHPPPGSRSIRLGSTYTT